MRVRRGLGLSLRALAANRARTALVLATIALGVCAVLATGALGAGAEREILKSLATLGPNLLVVRPAQVARSVSQRELSGRVTTLRPADVATIAAVPGVAVAAPGADGGVLAKAGRVATPATVMGTTAEYLTARGYRLARGRFIDRRDDAQSERVVVLGARIADVLFPRGDAIGAQLTIRRVPYAIVGTLAAKGATADGGDEDGQIVMPISTAMRRVFNRPWISTVFVSVNDRRRMDAVKSAVVGAMRLRHRRTRTGRDDFEIQNTASMFARQEQTLALFDEITGGLALVTSIAGGGGVLMLMWLSVNERTAEIGVRLAVGATPGAILLQFMVEAALLTLAGWAAGLVAGALLAAAIALTTSWSIAVPRDAALLSLAVMAATAIVPGIVPAIRASRITPVGALQRA
jgi:ABC-type antimicrobial peptide transport system permease subunit